MMAFAGDLKMTLFEVVNEKANIVKQIPDFLPNSPTTVILAPDFQVVRNRQTIHVTVKDTTVVIKLPDQFIAVSRFTDSALSINTANGSYIYSLSGKIIDTFVSGRQISAVTTDHEGNWWFCTLGQGVFRLISSEFKNFSFSTDTKPSPVYSIIESDSIYYFGLDKFRLMSMVKDRLQQEFVQTATSGSRVTSLVISDASSIILGTDDGLFLLKNGIKMEGIEALSVKSLQAQGKELLVAGHTGTYIIDLSELTIIDTVWKQRSTCAWKIKDDYYIGTLNGLYKVPRDELVDPAKAVPLIARRITALAESADGTLWVGTYGEGVVSITGGKPGRAFTVKDGLSSDNCRALFVNGNDLWVGTEKGLNRVRLAGTFNVTRFSIADGLASDIINTVYVHGTTVFVGTTEGLTRFNEAKITQESTCLLKLTAINTGTALWNHDTANFSVPNNNREIRFEFAGISFKSAGDITYYFRMVGLNSEWQTTRSAFLSYPSMPSGNYRFECYAVNKFGIKSNTLSIPFFVEKTLWEKWWFRILAGMVLASAVWMFIVFRIRTIRKREQATRKMEKRMADLEQMALKAQMNPHFIFNSLNSIQQYVLENDFKGVNNFITGFASLIRQTLDVSSKHVISLEEELNYISTYLRLEKMRLEDKFTYEIRLGSDIVPSDYVIPPLILQPCLENSIRHGIRYRKDKEGKITVDIRKNENYLICTIEDNGVGRKLAEQYKGARHIEYQSRGMSLTVSRIEMLPGNSNYKAGVDWEDITTDNGSVAGTRVIIKLPLSDIS